MRSSLPKRLLLMSGPYQDRADDERVASYLSRCGVEVVEVPLKHMQRGRFRVDTRDLPAGPLPFVGAAYRSLCGVRLPAHCDYPTELAHLLRRRVWPGVFRDLRTPVFVKPRGRLKRFTGRVVRDEREAAELGPVGGSVKVWFSDVVSMNGEYRVFLEHGYVLGVRSAPFQKEAPVSIDCEAVFGLEDLLPGATLAVDLATASDGAPVLVETNPPYSVGAYGLDAATYFDFLWSGWQGLRRS